MQSITIGDITNRESAASKVTESPRTFATLTTPRILNNMQTGASMQTASVDDRGGTELKFKAHGIIAMAMNHLRTNQRGAMAGMGDISEEASSDSVSSSVTVSNFKGDDSDTSASGDEGQEGQEGQEGEAWPQGEEDAMMQVSLKGSLALLVMGKQ